MYLSAPIAYLQAVHHIGKPCSRVKHKDIILHKIGNITLHEIRKQWHVNKNVKNKQAEKTRTHFFWCYFEGLKNKEKIWRKRVLSLFLGHKDCQIVYPRVIDCFGISKCMKFTSTNISHVFELCFHTKQKSVYSAIFLYKKLKEHEFL